MSGSSYKSYGDDSSVYRSYAESVRSNDTEKIEHAQRERAGRLRKSREHDGILRRQREREARAEQDRKQAQAERFDEELIRNKITSPKVEVKRVHVLAVDNSGSNAAIASHVRESSAYFNAFLHAIDPQSQVAILYFSDHCDGDRIRQDVDFFSPGEDSDSILYSTTARVVGADGGDFPEAIECVLYDLCGVDYRDATERHLYLITDAMPHGFGFPRDQGCPNQRPWELTQQRIKDVFSTFSIIGCGEDAHIMKYQERMLEPERLAWDLIDLSGITSVRHRRGITVNAFLFLAARNIGLQTVEMFLSMLYEKWLAEPIFGIDTDTEARLAIERFFKYLNTDAENVARMKRNILPE